MSLYRVVTEFQGVQGAPYFNTLFFDSSAGSAAQAAAAVGTFWGAIDTELTSSLSWATDPEIVTLNEVTGDIELISQVASESGSGGQAGEVGPTVLQALIRWRTGVPFDGRILRGRTFVPGLMVISQENGMVASTTQATLQNAATALVEDLNSDLSIWHRPVPPPDAEHPDRVQRDGAQADVSSATVASEFSVLRSRRD